MKKQRFFFVNVCRHLVCAVFFIIVPIGYQICFWVEQCMPALFECPEDVNEITKNEISKNHTKAVFSEFCVISLFMQKLIFGVT